MIVSSWSRTNRHNPSRRPQDKCSPLSIWYLPEEVAQEFVTSELEYAGTDPVLFTIRPDRWLIADFTDDAG